MPATGSAMSAIIGNVDSIVTAAIGWVGDLVGTITADGNELVLMFVLLPLLYTGVHLLKKLIRV